MSMIKGLGLLRKLNIFIIRVRERRSFLRRVKLLNNLYKTGQADAPKPVWKNSHTRGINNENFRADNSYVWQKRQHRDSDIKRTYDVVKELDKQNLLSTLVEKGDFCVETYRYDQISFSRDLMDSVLEINFLADHLQIPFERVIDLGAGYGRFASRILECNLANEVFCIDAIPKSTAISEIYLSEHIANEKARVIGMHERNRLEDFSFDLAVNIHSFSEMALCEVDEWVKFLRTLDIAWLFVVPNGPELSLNDGRSFNGILSKHGFEVRIKREKYSNFESPETLLYPSTYYLLENINNYR